MNRKCILTIFAVYQMLLALTVQAKENNLVRYVDSATTITCQAETEKYYWIGTNCGLYMVRKRDKRTYHMTTGNSNFVSDSIGYMVAKDNGEVYIGTQKGLMRYDNYTFLPVTSENSALRSNCITALQCVDGTVYAGTRDGGITVFYGRQSKTYSGKNAQSATGHVIAFQKTGDSLVALMNDETKIGIRNGQFTVIK